MPSKKTKRQQRDPMQEAIDILQTIPELSESFTRADLELALDDRGWMIPGASYARSEFDKKSRENLVAKSRIYWAKDPLAKQAVRLWTDYALGSGMQYKVEDDDALQTELDRFCKHRSNRRIMSSRGQRTSSKKLLIDGEVFFAIFVGDGVKDIRRFDPLQITDFITDPDDDELVLGYKRVCTGGTKTLYYYDWTADGDEELLDPDSKKPVQPEDGVVIYHLPFDELHQRGNGLLFAACDWSKEHRRFMEARVAIVQALAKFAWKQEMKGGKQVLDAFKQRMESTYAQSGPQTIERHPQPAPGATLLKNAGIDLTPMPRATGAGDASQDGNQLKLMVCAGTGIMLHYFGDPSTGNLATATAMELPMLKMFLSYQQLWRDAYRDIFSIVLDEDPDEPQDAADIDIDLPEILADDLQKLGQFLTSASAMFPELKVPQVLQMMLQSLGVSNLAEVMEEIEAKRAEIDANVKAGKNPDGSAKEPAVVPGQKLLPTEESYLVESVKELIGLLR